MNLSAAKYDRTCTDPIRKSRNEATEQMRKFLRLWDSEDFAEVGYAEPLRTWERSILNLRPQANGGRVRFQLSSVATGIEGPRDSRRGHEVKINSVLIRSRRRIVNSSGKTGPVKSDRTAREGS